MASLGGVMPDIAALLLLRADIEALRGCVDELKELWIRAYPGDPDSITPFLGEIERLLELLARTAGHALM